MNILIQTNVSPFQTKQKFGGAETSLKLIAQKLVEAQHNVVFIAKSNNKSFLGIQYTNKQGVEIYTFGKSYLPFANRYKVKKQLHRLHHFFVKRIIKNKNIEIVHTYYNPNICNFYLGLKQKLNFKLVVRIAGLKWYEDVRANPEKIKIYKNIFENSDLLNFISKGLYENFEQLNTENNFRINISDYFIGDIGVDIHQLKFSSTKKEHEDFQLVMATRFSNYQKRQDLLVSAAKKLVGKIPFKLILVGDGPNKKNIQKLIIENKLSEVVTIIPFLEQKELFHLIKNADLLCHSCDYEGLSKMIIETMCLGVPVLVSDVMPLNDYISDGVNGYLVENKVEAWADKIKYIYSNQNQLVDISSNAINYIKTNYNSDINIKIYLDEFEKINLKERF